jgi:hypothetical protein
VRPDSWPHELGSDPAEAWRFGAQRSWLQLGGARVLDIFNRSGALSLRTRLRAPRRLTRGALVARYQPSSAMAGAPGPPPH